MMDLTESSTAPEGSSTGKVPEKDAEQEPKPEATSNFQFLTFTDFQQTTDPRTKRKVRSHVMHRVHQTMRSGGYTEREGVIVLDTSSLLGESSAPQPSLPSPNALGAGRLNPFANYPIPMNRRTHQLFDHLRGDFCPMFKTMARIGFFHTMTDPAGFRQVLCTSACHIEVLRASDSEPSDAIVLTNQALKSVNDRLADPTLNTSDGVIAAILAFCCHCIMFKDPKTAMTHFSGLEEIIRLRGGLKSLDSNPVLRVMLFWADTNIAFTEDTPPRFPFPADLLQAYIVEPLGDAPIPMRLADCCTIGDIASAMKDLYRQNQLLISQAHLWNDGVFANLNLMPVLYKFLSIRYDHIGQDPVLLRQKAYRAGAILYLAAIRVRFNIDFSAEVHLRNLKDALGSLEDLSVDCDLPVLIWLLVVGGTRSIMKQGHDWFVSKLAQVIAFVDCRSWDLVLYHLKGVLWVDGVADEECEVVHREVSAKLLESYSHVFA